MKAAVKEAKTVYLATDPDREGEAISWHLADVLGLDMDDDNRIVFNEVTKDAVVDALNHPRKIDQNLVKSQETRRVLDRICLLYTSSTKEKAIGADVVGSLKPGQVLVKIVHDELVHLLGCLLYTSRCV